MNTPNAAALGMSSMCRHIRRTHEQTRTKIDRICF